MDLGKRKAVKTAFIILAMLVIGLLVGVSIPLIRLIKDPELFKEWIDSFGVFSPLIYIITTIISIVVAFIPGEPIELVAGYAFGSLKGTLLCILAESLGSIIVLYLTRKYGRKIVEIFFDKEKIDSLKFLHASKSRELLYAIIFIMPGTPKDLLCYFAGLTDIDFRLLIMITTLGRLPSIITSTLLGGNLSSQNYELAVLVLIITVVLSVTGISLFNKLQKDSEEKEKAE